MSDRLDAWRYFMGFGGLAVNPSCERLLADLQRYRYTPRVIGVDLGRDPVRDEIDRLDAAEREHFKGKPV